jgi:UDP-hydrolysing UDP-N-acetyl-D-glucosamine 2-epimerase
MQMQLYTSEQFSGKFDFDVTDAFILVTYHPETVDLRNSYFIEQLTDALSKSSFRVLCTLPNADTEGGVIRQHLLEFQKAHPEKIKCFEILGQKGYLSAMKYCTMMVGNTSSGIIEAASFHKPVVNVGNRQKGRLAGENVVHVENDSGQILDGISRAKRLLLGKIFENPYGMGKTAEKIIEILKKQS